jgi:hypothetical protein
MRFREVFLVVVLIVAGLVLYQYKTGHWNFDWNWGWSEDFGFVGKEVTAEETRTIEAPLPARSRSRTAMAGWRCAAGTRPTSR